MPQRVLTEAVQPEGLGAQIDALASQPLDLRRSTISRGTDSAETLLLRLGVSDAAAAAFIRQDSLARRLVQGRGGKLVQATADENGHLRQLVARYPSDKPAQRLTHFTRLTLDKVDGQWQARSELGVLATGVRLGSGSIRSSLFAATDDAGLPDAVASQLAEIFATDIDFHRELRKGDTFSVVYESLSADGETVPWNEGAGRVLAAEFVNAGKTHQAVWFVDGEGRGSYFGPDGNSRRRTFLASPLEFSRVTSGFAMRFHPLLQSWRAHRGVDYGAPTGTAVRSVSDGIVHFAGRQNGYGNVVEIQHKNNRSTLYAHLSRIDVRKGQRVEQGETVGAVGAHRLGHRPAPALRVPRRRPAPGPAADRQGRRIGAAGRGRSQPLRADRTGRAHQAAGRRQRRHRPQQLRVGRPRPSPGPSPWPCTSA